MLKKLFAPGKDSTLTAFALLVLRVWLGLSMFFHHGLSKFNNFHDMASKFFDPLGIGKTTSLGLVTFAETIGALLLVFGFLTRFGALVLAFDMGVALVLVHKAASGAGELAFVYLAGYITLLIAGGGKFSVDKAAFGKGGSSQSK